METFNFIKEPYETFAWFWVIGKTNCKIIRADIKIAPLLLWSLFLVGLTLSTNLAKAS